MAVNPIPEGYPRIIPYLVVADLDALVRFAVDVFGAKLTERMTDKSGATNHVELRLGDSMIMGGQVQEGRSPSPAMLYVYTEDTDAAYQEALAAGASSIMEPTDQFYGDRNAAVLDGNGNSWWIASHVEDVPDDEMRRRAAEREEKT